MYIYIWCTPKSLVSHPCLTIHMYKLNLLVFFFKNDYKKDWMVLFIECFYLIVICVSLRPFIICQIICYNLGFRMIFMEPLYNKQNTVDQKKGSSNYVLYYIYCFGGVFTENFQWKGVRYFNFLL